MIYTEAEHFIKESHNGVIRLGLGRIEELLERLGCPQKKLKFIHVAGTNGKGSVCAMTAEILKAAGYKTGLFTSPVISVYREQFRINGEMISEGEFVRYAELVRNACAKMTDVPSEFEKAVALAFLYFNENRCDFVVLEVGMGGCDDATNVIEVPEVAAIVNIDYDHMGSHFARESAVNVPITVCALPVISTSSGMPSVNCSRFIIIPPMLWLCFAPYGAIVPHGTSNVTSTRVPAGAYVPPAGLCLAARPSPCAFISNPFLLSVCAHSRMPIPITSGTRA